MKSLSDELKEQEFLGYWWIPTQDGQRSEHRAGVMRFSPNHRSELEVLGSFEDGSSQAGLKKYSVVNGAVHGGNRFTLFDCFTTRLRCFFGESLDLSNVRISFADAWIGPESYADKTEVRFHTLSVGVDGLAPWHNATAFSSECNFESQNVTLYYHCPDLEVFYHDNQVEISLYYAWQGSSQRNAQCEGSISHDPRIEIKALVGELPYYGNCHSHSFYLDRVHTFLGLMIGNGCSLYDCKGGKEKRELFNGDNLTTRENFYHLWRHDIEAHSQISPFDVWIGYSDVKQHLKKAFATFLIVNETVAGLARYFVHLNASRRTDFTQKILPELVYLFEGFHREIFCSKKQVDLKNRFVDAFSRVRDIFPFIDEPTRDQLIDYVKARRNNYAHANPDSYNQHIQLYVSVTTWMRMFLSAMLLEHCGIPANVIYASFSRHNDYGEISRTLSPLLHEYMTDTHKTQGDND